MEMVMNELDPREEPGSEEELVAGCAMLDSCAEIRTPDSLYNVLTHNFIRFFYQPSPISLIDYNNLEHRHYEQNRAPLGLYLHAAWFVREPEMMDALLFWLDEVLRTYGDTVYVVTMSQVLLITSAANRSTGSTTGCTITEKAPTRAFSWLKAATTAFTFKTLLRHYAKQVLTPRSLNVKLGPRRNYHKGRAAIRHYANQTARPL